MPRPYRLSDFQLVLLSTATQRHDGSLLPLPSSISHQRERLAREIPPLLKRRLVDEIQVAEADLGWRREGEALFGLIISKAGRMAINVDEVPADASVITPMSGGTAEAKTPILNVITNITEAPAEGSKIAAVLAMLKSEAGVTLSDLVDATGWLPHTTRAALSGLRKKGHGIVREKRGAISCYRIQEPA